MDLDGETALVTGSSGNIGRAIATTLAEAGADVGITTRSDRAGGEHTAEAVRAAGSEATITLGDLSDPSDVQQVVETTRDTLGPVTILVNNAAIRPKAPFLDLDLAEWDRVHHTNLRSAFLTAQQTIPDMIEAGGGAIVNFLGASAFLGGVGKSHVYASKMGLGGMIRSLAKEFGPDGIRVNGISPGPIDTERDMTDYPDDLAERMQALTPLGRMGEPREVADACCFLVSDRASYITGQILHVNGGIYPTPVLHGDE